MSNNPSKDESLAHAREALLKALQDWKADASGSLILMFGAIEQYAMAVSAKSALHFDQWYADNYADTTSGDAQKRRARLLEAFEAGRDSVARETEADARVQNLLRALDVKQAKIDALMLEFCPGEMSAEQRAQWEKHQQPVSADVERSITESFARSPRRVESAEKSEPSHCTCAKPEPALVDHGLASLCEKCGRPVKADPECQKCKTLLAFEGDECWACSKEER